MATDPTDNDSNELRKRRERLEALKSRRGGGDAPAQDQPENAAPASTGAGIGAGGGFPGLQDGPKRARQRKMLMKVYKVLTQTPEDENGRVQDTPFTESGVARLMELLQQRSSDPSQPGAKVAEGVLNFIRPDEGEETTASGASVAKLQAIARRVESFRNKGGAGGRRNAW